MEPLIRPYFLGGVALGYDSQIMMSFTITDSSISWEWSGVGWIPLDPHERSKIHSNCDFQFRYPPTLAGNLCRRKNLEIQEKPWKIEVKHAGVFFGFVGKVARP